MHNILVIDISGKDQKGLGTKHFKYMPQSGDWIAMVDENGVEIFYDVVQLVHSAEGNGCDMYVTNPRPGTASRAELHRSISGKRSS